MNLRAKPVSANPQPGPWTVTYFNPATGRRHPLIEGVDEATADRVVDRFGDNGDQYHRLPEVRKELRQVEDVRTINGQDL